MNTETITKRGKVFRMLLPKIQSMMTGVMWIDRAHDLVTLVYTDWKRESGTISHEEWDAIADNPYSIISAVQSRRK